MEIKINDLVIIGNGRYHRGPLLVVEVGDDYVIVSKHARVRINKNRITKVFK